MFKMSLLQFNLKMPPHEDISTNLSEYNSPASILGIDYSVSVEACEQMILLLYNLEHFVTRFNDDGEVDYSRANEFPLLD